MNEIELPNPPARVLLIKPSSLGDIVHTLPVLDALRHRWPDAKISWLCGSAFVGLLEGHPQLDEVIPFERRLFGSWWWNPRVARDLFRFTRGLRERKFDLVIDMQGLFRSGWLSWLTHAPVRVGFANAREMAHIFYTHRVPVLTMEQHAVDRYLTIARAFGCEKITPRFEMVVHDEDRAYVDAMVNGIGRYALLMPGTNWPTKRWSAGKFAELVAPLKEMHGLSTVVAGTPEIAELAAQIPADVNMVGKTSLRQLVALIGRAELVIANDSGPMHIAAALNRPLISLFGPTNPLRTGPYQQMHNVLRVDIPCSPCYSRSCSHTSCMKWISPDAVMNQTKRAMESAGPAENKNA